MPTGPKGQKRPADVVANAVKVMRIATGEEAEQFDSSDGKDKAAQDMGRRGGKARASKLSAKERTDIARAAARARYAKK